MIGGFAGLARTTFDPSIINLFRSDDQRVETFEEIWETFGTADSDCLVVIEWGPGEIDEALIAELRVLEDELVAVKEVRRVVTPFTALSLQPGSETADALTQWQRAREHPVTSGRLVAEDGKALLFAVSLDPAIDGVTYLADRNHPIHVAAARFTERTDARATLTGVPVLRAAMLGRLRVEEIMFVAIGGTIGAIISLLLFRRLVAVAIVAAGPLIATLWIVGLMGWAGEAINPVNVVVPTLVLVVGFTDAVHLLHAIRDELRAGASPRAAARAALRAVGPACVLTSVTTAIGFSSLMTARIDVIARFGATAAVGTIMAMLAVTTVVPLLAGTGLGSSIARAGEQRRERARTFGTALVRFVTRHARIVAIAGSLTTIAFAATCLRLEPNSAMREGLPVGDPAVEAMDTLESKFGGVFAMIVHIGWDESVAWPSPELDRAFEEATALLASERSTGTPQSILDLLPRGPGGPGWHLLPFIPEEAVARVLNIEDRQALVSAMVPDDGIVVHLPMIDRLEAALADLNREYSGITFTLSGNPVAVGYAASHMIEDLAVSLTMASGVIFIVLAIAFRSLRLGLISVIPNAFPLVVAGASLVFLDVGLTITGVITFCVCLGVAVDDTIHLISRYRRAVRTEPDPRRAAESAVLTVGAALVTTTAVLIGGFAAVFISDLPIMQMFGSLSCLALLAALVGDLLILPALLVAAPGGEKG